MSLVAGGAMLRIELRFDPRRTHDKVNAHIAIGFVLLPWQLAHVISVIADQQPARAVQVLLCIAVLLEDRRAGDGARPSIRMRSDSPSGCKLSIMRRRHLI